MNAEAERIKLTAAFLNNAAVGVALAGFIKPLVDAADASLTRYAWLLAAATLHSWRGGLWVLWRTIRMSSDLIFLAVAMFGGACLAAYARWDYRRSRGVVGRSRQ